MPARSRSRANNCSSKAICSPCSRRETGAVSVVRGDLAWKEHVGEPEPGQIRHAHRVQHTVEVIALVLDDASVKSIHYPVDRISLRVDTDVAEPQIARNHATQTGHREASFPALLHFVG